MTSQNELLGKHNAFALGQLVVELKHIDLVEGALRDLRIEVLDRQPGDTDPGLGLALVTLQSPIAAAGSITYWRLDPERALPVADDRSAGNLDIVLRGLRRYFRQRYAGWTPILAKNRTVGQVIGGVGKIWHRPTQGIAGSAIGLPGEPKFLKKEDKGVPDVFQQQLQRDSKERVRVALIDTAIRPHYWLNDAWEEHPGYSPQAPSADQPAMANHATFVAGLILRQAPGCKIVSHPVLAADTGTATSWDVAKAIVQATEGDTPPPILNLSLACYTEDGHPPLLLAVAIERVSRKTLVVCAAGNHGHLPELGDKSAREERKPAWPAALSSVVTVGAAADRQGGRSDFTPRNVPWIDVLAPGEAVVSTYILDDIEAFAEWSGTSFAAASVSGAIADRMVSGKMTAREAWDDLRERATMERVSRGGDPAYAVKWLDLSTP